MHFKANGMKVSKMSEGLMSDTLSNAKKSERKQMIMNSGMPESSFADHSNTH